VSDPPADPGQSSLAVKIDSEKTHPLAWKAVVKRAAMVVVAGIAIYLVLPAITEVLASWPRLSTLDPRWFILAIGAQVAHFICTFALQRLALRTRGWFGVVTSQLAGNAITLIMPGGAAMGAAVQFRMLAASGMDVSSTVGGLTAFSLLGVGGLLALPVFALPVVLLGAPVDRGLVNAAILGAVGFVAFAAFGAVLLAYDAPMRWAGRVAQRLRNWILRKRPPLVGLDETLLSQRNEIRAVLGRQWWRALLLSSARLAFDYLCLLAALRATGSRPRPSLILVAYAAAGIIGDDPGDPRRSRTRGGEPDRAACAGPGRLQPGGAGDAHLPAGLLLGAAVRRADRLRRLPDPLPGAPVTPAHQRCGCHRDADRVEPGREQRDT
jgi:uncharacterized membrane protein YbhN (UPF0104 family)